MENYAKSMNTKAFKVYVQKRVFLGGTNEVGEFSGSSKETVVCDMSIFYSLFSIT